MTDPSRTCKGQHEKNSFLKQRIRELEQVESERKRVYEAPRKSEEYFKAIIQNSSDIVLILDKLGIITYASRSVERFLGYESDELVGKKTLDLIVSDDKLRAIADFGRALLTKEVLIPNVFRIRHKDGTEHTLEGIGRNLFDNPIIAGFVMNVRDITDRKQAEKALKESEERYRSLVENASDLVYRMDSTGHVIFVNPSGCSVTGYAKEELMGKNYSTLIRPDMREEAIKFFGRQFVKRIKNTYSEFPILTKEGNEVWLGQNTHLIVEDNNVIGFQSMSRDITARKRVEEELGRNQNVSKRLAQEIAIIAEIGKVVGSTLDTEEVYEKFAIEVRKLIPLDRLAVNLHSIHKENIRVAYVFGEKISGRCKGDLFPLKGSVSEVLTKTRAGLFSHPKTVEEMDKRFPNHVATVQAGMRSLMGVPLIYRDEVIGSLHFRSRTLNAYSERDLHLAEKIGMQIAGAIGSAQLFSDLKSIEKSLRESENSYRELSIIDDLTQLYNSRHFYFQLKNELYRSNRYGTPLALLLLDIDNFKAFNDAYGHIEGDQVLLRLGQVIKRCLRETDFAYRYGGEEFTILLPMTTNADGTVIAERIRTEFRKETFSPVPGQNVHVTLSIGLAQYRLQEEMKDFVHRVDQLMYQGKKCGKDTVCSESSI
jgi:diguanylate cyclase (GGDEF)-like protein/PAS domain S-box-containing protein